MPKYKDSVYNDCKYLFVVEGKTIREIAEIKNSKPCFGTLGNWSRAKDPHNEDKNWFNLRDEQRALNFEQLAPGQRIAKLYEEMDRLMQMPHIDADKVAKLSATINRIAEPKYQVPVMYHMLEKQLLFLKDKYPKILTDEFKKMIVEFKDVLRIELTK